MISYELTIAEARGPGNPFSHAPELTRVCIKVEKEQIKLLRQFSELITQAVIYEGLSLRQVEPHFEEVVHSEMRRLAIQYPNYVYVLEAKNGSKKTITYYKGVVCLFRPSDNVRAV